METIERVKIGYFKVLKYTKDYDGFTEFYDENKTDIYVSIIEMFEEFKKSNKKVLTINLSSTISGMYWETDLGFSRDQYFMLKRDVLPYFEENEDYEMCQRILSLHNEFVAI